jgi:hypothetical protein
MFPRLTGRRLVYRIRLVCLMTAGLAMFVAPAMQAGSTPAKGKVRIDLRGKVMGSPDRPQDRAGRFILSGAISDRGRFVDHVEIGANRTLYGARGTLWIRIRPVDQAWRITKGSGAYARLRGRGTQRGLYGAPSAPRVRLTMIGTVWR